MNTLLPHLGWMFVALSALFTLGVTPRFARLFYPTSPPLMRRLAAPVIFACLAGACFMGFAAPALSSVVVLGIALIIVSRSHDRRRKSPR